MDDPFEQTLGERLRRIRQMRGLPLRVLAEKSGLSANAISLIERGKNSPTVSSLHRLANAFEIPIAAFFQSENNKLAIFTKRNQGHLFRGNGISIERVGNGLPDPQFEVLSITVHPGYGTMDEPISHAGEEVVRCLEGQVEYYVEAAMFLMEGGDSLLFDASQPHSFRNTSHAPAILLTILQAGEHQHLRQSKT